MSAERELARPLDPNVLQRQASDPSSSIWVSASAGTGKTKVLTDRVLRLLLPQGEGTPGSAPHKILGLTFTKAAASEMALRINETLSSWSVAPQEKLTTSLQKLLGRKPQDNEIAAARQLFAHVIDTPGRLKIMTIHAFCQSVLSRFPLESGLTPGFEVAEERVLYKFLQDAKASTFKAATEEKGTPLNAALENLSHNINEDQLGQLIHAIASERGQLDSILEKHFGIDGFYTALCQSMDIQPNRSKEEILEAACEDQSFDRAGLKYCADAMAQSNKTDIKNAAIIHDFLSRTNEERMTHFETYQAAFFKKDGEIRAKLMSKKLSDEFPHLLDIMASEAQRLHTIIDTIKASETAALTRDILLIGQETLQHYAAIKAQDNMLDYEDLIFKTRDLMKSSGSWVQYKLDQGIDHILIDEAQDTNPEQWSIIEALTEEFFAAHSESDDRRTIFTVGDEKQSIYSFQRASPEEFDKMRNHFSSKITMAQKNWHKVDLNISFRSVKSVLAAVDTVFSNPQNSKGLGIGAINHDSFRRGQAGRVEVWPVFESDAVEDIRTWDPPITIMDQKSGSTKCAENIANAIQNWIENSEILESHNRPIEPRDIMILVRTRNAFVGQLMRALKIRNIPVGGMDRIILNDQIVVQDMLAICQFALLPSDDLTLACLLKSPLIGMDEDALFEVAYNRPASLWASVQDKAAPEITDYLKGIIQKASLCTPYTYLSNILQTPCPADSMSGLRAFQKRLGTDAHDALNELLNAALSFEKDQTPALQNFLQWQKQNAGNVKRDHDDQNNHIRIMTVHGSKGLQAPIIFLPDTTSTPGLNPTQAGNRLLWPTQTGQELPVWSPRKDTASHHYSKAKDAVLERLDEEYRRLLYVAMTRAEDRLYITGYKGKQDIAENCWYSLCHQALKSYVDTEKSDEKLILQNPQIKEPDRTSKAQTAINSHTAIPDWMSTAAPAEPHPPITLMPSRPAEADPTAISPLKSDNNYRFRRGNVTHKLLQFLPDIPENQRHKSMQDYLTKHAGDLPDSVHQNIMEEIEKILNHAAFKAIFGENAKAEVPITGLLKDGRIVSGQIDRLIITDQEIIIVDFKTNRPPPKTPQDIPLIYKNQMQAYADILREIYPNHKIHCALLWTDGPNLMPVESSTPQL